MPPAPEAPQNRLFNLYAGSFFEIRRISPRDTPRLPIGCAASPKVCPRTFQQGRHASVPGRPRGLPGHRVAAGSGGEGNAWPAAPNASPSPVPRSPLSIPFGVALPHALCYTVPSLFDRLYPVISRRGRGREGNPAPSRAACPAGMYGVRMAGHVQDATVPLSRANARGGGVHLRSLTAPARAAAFAPDHSCLPMPPPGAWAFLSLPFLGRRISPPPPPRFPRTPRATDKGIWRNIP